MIDPWKKVLDEVRKSKTEAENALGFPHIESKLEEPPEGMGDVGFDVFQYVKALKKKPIEIAEELARKMKIGILISSYTNAGPYVNAHINMANFSKLVLESILKYGDDYGSHPSKDVKVILEHTSVNPTGPVHVGRARNPILGDTIARIMKKAGYEVTTEFYVNDVGKQVVMLAWGVLNLPEGQGESSGKIDHELVKAYQKAYERSEQDSKVSEEISEMLQKFESGDSALTRKIESIVQKMLDGMLSSLERINIKLDGFKWESEFLLNKKVYEIIEKLKGTEQCKDENGAYYLDIERFVPGQEKYFITRGDGTTLYTARDLAYHLNKFERCDLCINILGEDQKLGMEALKIGLRLLGADKAPENVFYSFVSLPEGRMSTRKGVVVYLDDLIDEALERAVAEIKKRRTDLSEAAIQRIANIVSVGAIRYNIVKVQAEKSIVFKWSEALNFEGNSAPFIQYAHARCHGILSKAEEPKAYDASKLVHPNEINNLKTLSKFPSLIEECAEGRKAHPISSYAFGLASDFNLFYRDCPVLNAEEDLQNARLALVESTKIVLKNALDCMGIEAPGSM
jgi:arginyl-tRNA synthetase